MCNSANRRHTIWHSGLSYRSTVNRVIEPAGATKRTLLVQQALSTGDQMRIGRHHCLADLELGKYRLFPGFITKSEKLSQSIVNRSGVLFAAPCLEHRRCRIVLHRDLQRHCLPSELICPGVTCSAADVSNESLVSSSTILVFGLWSFFGYHQYLDCKGPISPEKSISTNFNTIYKNSAYLLNDTKYICSLSGKSLIGQG